MLCVSLEVNDSENRDKHTLWEMWGKEIAEDKNSKYRNSHGRTSEPQSDVKNE